MDELKQIEERMSEIVTELETADEERMTALETETATLEQRKADIIEQRKKDIAEVIEPISRPTTLKKLTCSHL